jgi:hypothetical protein
MRPLLPRLTEDDKGHVTVLLWRITQADLAKTIGVHTQTLCDAMYSRMGLPEEALAKLRTLRREDFEKTRKSTRKGWSRWRQGKGARDAAAAKVSAPAERQNDV